MDRISSACGPRKLPRTASPSEDKVRIKDATRGAETLSPFVTANRDEPHGIASRRVIGFQSEEGLEVLLIVIV